MAFEQVMHFHKDTPEALRKVLRKCFHAMNPVRIQYGDTDTGRAWMEENDVVGRIGRSTGPMKVPLIIEPLVAFEGAIEENGVGYADGGTQLLDHCILRVLDCFTGQELYRHPKYACPIITVKSNDDMETYNKGLLWMVVREELTEKPELLARFETYEEACGHVALLQGIKTHHAFRTQAAWSKEQKEHDDDNAH